ncbi:hypothetical protein B0H67DRAFT_62166 [Lasiosphaeris hirsuta]|uniref:Uncharacterized protein n=1 Tax=Lasiosphaeris hirsuta TaxID=260670 RepID=A0AA40EBG7_9PEZI|nr:hypothetical protein B0H67DRAFT_62166 [Lasiosphaeris hirsuta]
MNTDEIMSDPSQAFTPPTARGGGSGGNGYHILDFITPSTDPTQSKAGPSAATIINGGLVSWNTKKFRDEYEVAKARLSDLKFNIGEYPDPLLPRQPHRMQYPSGVTAEMERQLQALIANIRERTP